MKKPTYTDIRERYWFEFLEYVKRDTAERVEAGRKRLAAFGGGTHMIDVRYIEDSASYECYGLLEEAFWRWYMEHKMQEAV